MPILNLALTLTMKHLSRKSNNLYHYETAGHGFGTLASDSRIAYKLY